jgi:hypothetical protein
MEYSVVMQWSLLSPRLIESTPSLRLKLFQLIEETYRDEGGYADYKSEHDLPGEHELWWVWNPDDPHVVIFGKHTDHGQKWTGIGRLKSREAKMETRSKVVQILSELGGYMELTEGKEYNLLSAGCVFMDTEDVKHILAGKHIDVIDDKWYFRQVHGQERKKVMIGLPLCSICKRSPHLSNSNTVAL